VPTLYGLMLHREEYLGLWEKGLGEILLGFVKDGRAHKIGVSVYSPEKALLALQTDGIDLVQLPSNIFDRRFEQACVFELADDVGKTIYIRSVFLQGLLLMAPEMLPSHMAFTCPFLEKLNRIACDFNVSEKEICLRYAKAAYPCAKIVIGIETPRQLEENVAVWNRLYFSEHVIQTIQDTFTQVDEKVLDPSLWPKTND
ncbi:MAG: aldo/keto reductase, partial [Desulfobacteraceae bacterium]|nr:aldo/keto reductase [Desulfobacteraceae bacterium]